MSQFYDDASLVMIPAGTKAGKVYSQKPTDGSGDLTFTRSSHATRVNAAGNVEKARTNSLVQSNQFDTTWTNYLTTETGGQADKDGGTDAWLLDKSGAAGQIKQSISISGVYTFSVYVKAGTTDWVRVGFSGGANGYFDLTNGVVGSVYSGTAYLAIEAVGSGWYRCSIASNTSSSGPTILPAESDGSVSGTSGNIYIQDAQLEQGLVATDYIETTTAAVTVGIYNDVPRLDYSGGASCPALLLEPQRSNILPYSEYFENYPKVVGGTGVNPIVTTNYATSPEGLQNATRVQFDAGSNGFSSLRQYVGGGPIPHTATNSVYIKSLSGNVSVNLGDGLTGAELLSVTTEWQRFDITDLVSYTGTHGWHLMTNTASGNPITTQSVDILIWGAQMEMSASYPTSYIPTYGSTVTRSEDSTYKTGISSLIGQTEGTVFFEFDQKLIDQSTTRRLLALTDGTTNNRIVVYISAANKLEYYVRNTTGQLFLSTGVTVGNTTGVHKVAAVYKDGDYAIYMDGAEVASGAGSAGTIPACSRLDVGEQLGANQAYEPFNKVLLFTTRLSNADLAELTTL